MKVSRIAAMPTPKPLVAALVLASLGVGLLPHSTRASVIAPNWVELSPEESLCRAHTEATRMQERARDDIYYLKDRINENRKLGKRSKTSEEFRQAVTAVVAGYIAASATMTALGGGFSAGTITGTSTARLAVGAAVGLIEGCQALIHLTVAGASFVSTTMIVGLIGKWLSQPNLEVLTKSGTADQQREFQRRQEAIETLKQGLTRADERLAAFSEPALTAFYGGISHLTAAKSSRHARQSLHELQNYELQMRELLLEVDASTTLLQARIEEHCTENKLTCALGFSRKGNASDWLGLESALLQDRLLRNTALAMQAGNVANMIVALIRANFPGQDAQSLCQE